MYCNNFFLFILKKTKKLRQNLGYLREKLPKFQEAFPCSNIGICYNIPSAAIYTNHSNFWENRSLVAAHGDDVCVCENGTFLFLLPLSDTFSFLTAFGNHPNCLILNFKNAKNYYNVDVQNMGNTLQISTFL